MKTQKEVREAFWQMHEEFRPEFRTKKRQNDYRTDIRVAFVDFVDNLRKSGEINDALANRVTL